MNFLTPFMIVYIFLFLRLDIYYILFILGSKK